MEVISPDCIIDEWPLILISKFLLLTISALLPQTFQCPDKPVFSRLSGHYLH